MNWSKLSAFAGRLLWWRPKPLVLPTAKPTAPPPTALVRHQLRVLLVDIDPKVHYAIVRHMRALGHELVGSSELPHALAVAQQWVPNLIVYGNLSVTNQWLFAHKVLGNEFRTMDNWPMPNRPYLVRIWPKDDDRERMLS